MVKSQEVKFLKLTEITRLQIPGLPAGRSPSFGQVSRYSGKHNPPLKLNHE